MFPDIGLGAGGYMNPLGGGGGSVWTSFEEPIGGGTVPAGFKLPGLESWQENAVGALASALVPKVKYAGGGALAAPSASSLAAGNGAKAFLNIPSASGFKSLMPMLLLGAGAIGLVLMLSKKRK